MKTLTLCSFATLLLLACDSGDKPQAQPKKPEAAAPAAAPEAAPETAPEADKTPPAALANAEIGQPAPDFALPDLDGKETKLSDHKGKIVVLEWFNPECPFVKFAHGDGPLKTMAKEQTDKGIVWIAVNSGAPGKQGHGAETNRKAAAEWGLSHPILLDEDGSVGKAYGAKTTPHLFIVDPEGKLVFRGGVDNAPMGEAEGDLQSYVTTALAELGEGKPVSNADVRSYGCSVKYAS